MKDPQSVHPESVTSFSRSTPTDAAPDAVKQRRTMLIVGGALAVAVMLALALFVIRPAAPTPMALEPAPAPAPTAPPAPTATPTPVPMIAVGFTPGARDQQIPMGAAVEHLGPVELINGETECYVAFGEARVWGPCAALGLPDAPRPTPVPPPPAPRPAAPQTPAWSPPAPAPAAPAPVDLVPSSAGETGSREKPCGARCAP